MSSIRSTQNRHIFLRRKYCFFPAIALSPPVGRCEALIGLPPLVSAIFDLLDYSFGSAGNPGAVTGSAGIAGAAAAGSDGPAGKAGDAGRAGVAGRAGAAAWGAGRRDARLSRAFFRFS